MSMYMMAKNIMISDNLYFKLKRIKERRNESFTEVISDYLEKPKKTGEGLKECLGIIKDDKEYDKIMKETGKRWSKWTRQYA